MRETACVFLCPCSPEVVWGIVSHSEAASCGFGSPLLPNSGEIGTLSGQIEEVHRRLTSRRAFRQPNHPIAATPLP